MLKELFEAIVTQTKEADARIGQPTTLPLDKLGDGQKPFMLNKDLEPRSLEGFLPCPAKKEIILDFVEAASFVEYVNEQKEKSTRIFANVCLSHDYTITAVIDYHGVAGEAAKWGTHKAKLLLRPTEEWKTWRNMNKKPMSQEEFAVFLEDHQPDIIRPDGATILEIASTMEGTKEISFHSSVRLDNTTTKFKFDEEMSATAGVTGELDIPNEFTIDVPVFQGEKKREIDVRFRYSHRQGILSFRYELVRPKEAERETVDELSKRIREETKLPVFIMGSSV